MSGRRSSISGRTIDGYLPDTIVKLEVSRTRHWLQ
jgi:hypothetical protein